MNRDSELSIDEFLDGVVRWITFTSSTSGENTLQGLFNGRLIAEALCSIDPDFFTEEWYEDLNFGSSSSQHDNHARLMTQRDIVRKVYEFYQAKRQKNIQSSSNWKVDVPKLVEHQSKREIKKLSVLLMGVAVVGGNTPFMRAFEGLGREMLEEIQTCIKVLEDDMSQIDNSALSVECDFLESRQLQEECDRLRHQVKTLLVEKASYEERERDMMSEMTILNQKINDTFGYSVEKEKLEMRNQKLQADFTELEANFGLVEKERDEFRRERDEFMGKCEDLHTSYTSSEAENRKLRDLNSELAERLKSKEGELSQLRSKTDKDFAREISDKERENKILKDKCRSYVKEIASFESISRRNDSLGKQLAQANAMFEEQNEQLQKAETQYKNELAKQAARIEELQQRRLLLEARIHNETRLGDFREKDNFESSPFEECTTTSNCSSPSLNEELSSMNIQFNDTSTNFYNTIDELKAEKKNLVDEIQKIKEHHEQQISEMKLQFKAEKNALKEEITQLHQRLDLYRQAGRVFDGSSSSRMSLHDDLHSKHSSSNSNPTCVNENCHELASEVKRLKNENEFLQNRLAKLKILEEECNQYEFENKLLTSKIYEMWLKEVKLDAGHPVPVSTSAIALDHIKQELFQRQTASRASTSSSSSSTTRSLFSRFRSTQPNNQDKDNNSLSTSSIKPTSTSHQGWLKFLIIAVAVLLMARFFNYFTTGDRFTLFGQLPTPHIEYVSEPPL